MWVVEKEDNLFVINAITNEASQKNAKPYDVCAYNVRKCFDCLWLQECIDEIWEAAQECRDPSLAERQASL